MNSRSYKKTVSKFNFETASIKQNSFDCVKILNYHQPRFCCAANVRLLLVSNNDKG